MSWLVLDASGELQAIYNSFMDGALEADVPEGYPETMSWDAATGAFVHSVDKFAAQLLAAVDAFKNAKQDGPAVTPFGIIDNDDAKSKGRLNSYSTMALVAKMTGGAFTINWTKHDNSVETLDADQMIAMASAAGEYVAQVQDHSNALKAQIRAAGTIADLAAIDLTAGWP